MKKVNLSVHKNKVEAHRKRVLARDLTSASAKMVRENDIRAYALVGIGADGRAYAQWDTGAILPRWAFADTVATVLRTDIASCEDEDDWRPALPLKGSKG